MNVIVAGSAGFCFGVNKAVNTVYDQIEKSSLPVYTYGPIIHNQLVVRDLEEKGVRVLNTLEELEAVKEGTVIIRSHGVPGKVRRSMDREGIVCVDATCPFVSKIHRIVEKDSSEGSVIVIAGDPEHPEVEGIRGWVNGECFIINSTKELEELKISPEKKITFVAQTTYNHQKFKEFVEIFNRLSYNVKVCSTVCSATEERQSEAMEIAQKVDAMIVIGDRHSSNTRKLYDICNRKCKYTYFIETIVDLKTQPFQSVSDVGITAGASTPTNILEEVQNCVRNEC